MTEPRLDLLDLLPLDYRDGEVGAYLHDRLGPALDSDNKPGRQLIATLRAYLDNWGDYQLTARTLGIHTSTVRYRVHIIREALVADLAEGDARFDPQAASRLLGYMDGDFDIAPGDHMCAIYSGPAERDAILRPFLDAGLGAGHKCLIGLQDPDAPSVIRSLGMQADVDRCLASRQLDVLGADDPQFSPEDFSIPEMLDFWDRTVAEATTEGYEVARLSAEAAWWSPQLPGDQAMVAYESELSAFTARQSAAILCLYDLNDCTAGLVIDLVKTHPRTMINRLVVRNPWHLRPEEFRASRQTHGR